jgi:hypothetical protein
VSEYAHSLGAHGVPVPHWLMAMTAMIHTVLDQQKIMSVDNFKKSISKKYARFFLLLLILKNKNKCCRKMRRCFDRRKTGTCSSLGWFIILLLSQMPLRNLETARGKEVGI